MAGFLALLHEFDVYKGTTGWSCSAPPLSEDCMMAIDHDRP
jgi:hypothetical protein